MAYSAKDVLIHQMDRLESQIEMAEEDIHEYETSIETLRLENNTRRLQVEELSRAIKLLENEK